MIREADEGSLTALRALLNRINRSQVQLVQPKVYHGSLARLDFEV